MRHLNMSSLRSICLAGMFAGSGLLASAPAAQAQPRVVVFDPEVIVADRASYERVKTQLQVANTIVMDYLKDSTKAIEQGHRLGYANFEVWYRQFRSRKEDATVEIMKVVLKHVLTKGLDIVFADGAPFTETIAMVAEHAYDLAVQNLGSPPAGDVDGFLAGLKAAEETYMTKLLDTPEQFRQAHPDAFEAAQWEIVNLWMDGTGSPSDRTIPASAIEILSAVGVPEPGRRTATAVGESVMVSHVTPIYENTPTVVQGAGPYSLRAMAQVAALRQFDLNGNKQRICQIERRSFSSFYWSVPRGECDMDR